MTESVVDEHEFARNVREHLEHHTAPRRNPKCLNAAQRKARWCSEINSVELLPDDCGNCTGA